MTNHLYPHLFYFTIFLFMAHPHLTATTSYRSNSELLDYQSFEPFASLMWLPITTTCYICKVSASSYFRYECWVWAGNKPAPGLTGLWCLWQRAIPDHQSVLLGHVRTFIGRLHYPRLGDLSCLKSSHKLVHLHLKSQETLHLIDPHIHNSHFALACIHLTDYVS